MIPLWGRMITEGLWQKRWSHMVIIFANTDLESTALSMSRLYMVTYQVSTASKMLAWSERGLANPELNIKYVLKQGFYPLQTH